MFAALDEFLRSEKAEVYLTSRDADSDAVFPEPLEDADIYCDNSECDLNIPKCRVVTGPFVRRMEWKAKDGSVKHFCETCGKAVAIWQAERA